MGFAMPRAMLRFSIWLLVVGAAGLRADAASAALPSEALRTLRHVAIQHDGRNKPFDSFARETLDRITGSPKGRKGGAVETVLSIISKPERWQDEPLIAIPFVPLREALGLDSSISHVSYNALIATRTLMRLLPPIMEKQRRDERMSMLENETMDAYDRFVRLSALFEQRLHMVPPTGGIERVWHAMLEPSDLPSAQQTGIRTAWTALLTALRDGDAQQTTRAASDLAAALRAVDPAAYPPAWQLRLEVGYNRFAPFVITPIAYLLAALLFLVGFRFSWRWVPRLGMTVLWIGFVLHGAAMLVRVVVGGRPPVSNFYESVLWLPFVGVLAALVLERIYRTRYLVFSAALLAAITLALAGHLPLDSSITPVVAVLRSTLWLTIHVLTIVASYGVLALATVLAHCYGWQYLVRGAGHPALPTLGLLTYRAIQVGVILLAGGIMLGAVWANASWGRYWGWDPKETWALITLLWYVALLHGRFVRWIRGVGLALATIGGFFLLLMTYYGVSFYLAGLHSYAGGHAKPLPPLLIGYLIAEVVFMGLVGMRALASRQTAS